MEAPLIDLASVTHAYRTDTGPVPVLDDLSIACPEGSFTAVVGPSGCGKSTLTKLIAGLMIPDSGRVSLHGEPVRSPRSTMGMAFQNPVLLEWRTIVDNVVLPLEIVPNALTKCGSSGPWTCWPLSGWKGSKASGPRSCRTECANEPRSPRAGASAGGFDPG